LRRRIEQQFVELQIEPAAEFEPRVPNGTAKFKPHPPMQRNAGRVLCIDAADQRMKTLTPRRLD